MRKADRQAYFEEIEHTADVALKVHAGDFPALVQQATLGMLYLMEINLPNAQSEREVSLRFCYARLEDLLVQVLNEILFWIEQKGEVLCPAAIHLADGSAVVQMQVYPFAGTYQEIKAVTYHQLMIMADEQGMHTSLVFDV